MTDQATQDAPTYADHRPAVARAALAQPVSAERVPLTDEQLTDIWNASLLKPQSVYAFARAIERAHGISR